ncbi:hypothetical protein [Granulicella tundricola]|uniref:Uncharacterized protein n=1 Tax=Granulicella tundricola (strain ATCC BAA-1859 / DSM 23138 / MP5ACTX9) TaxID=1198114 RepID=E8X1W0_GRATM|nr:hypothetical protein [Granulicella tundricola]ADW69121.1 hypothetical protein AciX9_2076 [Granulicella tundricola MP5ACTX9]
MTKQMKAAMAAMLMVGTLPMMAQTSETKTVKVAPGQTKTTVIHRKNGATDTVVSEGTSTGVKHTSRKRVVRKGAKAPVESATAREIRELKERQTAQQAQIDALTAANAAKDAALVQAQQTAANAETQAQAATQQAQSVSSTVQATSDQVQALKSNVSDLQTTNVGLAQTISANKVELQEKIDSPLAIHYKGVTITPVAFFALEGVWRQRSINSDINTPFNTTPYPGSNEAHISEFNLSGRQSRLGGLFEGNAGKYKLSGYFEADFLSAGTTSNENQSNSYTLRQRQFWGKAETQGGFAVTGGQTWSLVTEDGKGTDVRTEKLPNTVDPQYMVGYSWARQPGIRLQRRFGDATKGAVTVAIAAEQAQIQLGTTANAPANFIFGGVGTSGGLLNAGGTGATGAAGTSGGDLATYTNDVAPDIIAKVAFDNKYGHVELGGLARFFRDAYAPLVLNANGTTNSVSSNLLKNTKTGGGVFGSARVSPSKYADIAVQAMAGDGTARYGSSQLGDVTVHPDGTLAPIHNYHGMFSLETHPTKKLDVYGYYGYEYNQRTVYTSPAGVLTGYGVLNANDSGCNTLTIPTTGVGGTGGVNGAPGTVGTCASPTKNVQEGMIGFTYKVVNSPKYGRLQYQATYSYLQRTSWEGLLSGTFGTTSAQFTAAHATNNMIHVGMRYYIP